MAFSKVKEFVVIMLIASILPGCVNSGDESVKTALPSPVTPTTPATFTDTAKPTPSQPVELNLAESTIIGESSVGMVYEWQNKLFTREREGIIKTLGDPNMNKFQASISADGSHLLYNRKESKGALSQVPCEISLLDVESGQEMNVLNPDESILCHKFGWLDNNIYVQWNEFPSSGLTDLTIFDGQSGEILESGWLYQYLEKWQTRIVLLHPPNKDEELESLGADIRIGALTPDGAFHLLFEQNIYEVQFLDIQVSHSLGAMSILSHHLPTQSSQLWMAPVDMEQWSTGDWQTVDIKPDPDGRTISFDKDGFVVLSDGRRFELPWLD
ncbi:hypothetical protein [Paenibacillus chungangensis]|uniref:Uncharacterized protein n=1 Tax=Paenibacillus chungangensis TaxID=696535 RepID=A0ABW3HKT6_9BACL